MTKILNVPYRSQWDADANKSTTDCGPACLAMVLDYYGHHESIDNLFSATGVQPGRYTGYGQLQRVALSFGLTFQYRDAHNLNDLKRWIDEGKPAIALVKYSAWSQIEPGVSTQDGFTGPHFVVVVGYGNGNIYINDPNYWPPRREEGHKKAWSEVLFNLAWSNVRTSSVSNPNNSVIVPVTGQTESASPPPETASVAKVTDYIVQPGDSWSNIAAKFYGDQSRYPEILAFNNLSAGATLYVGQKLRIPIREGEGGTMSSGQTIVLGTGATQQVDADLVGRLKTKWVSEGKLTATADETAVLRAFTDEIQGEEAKDTPVIEYIVQPGDTWSGIAGKFFGDQTRYREIMEFNQLASGASLFVGQKLKIPPQ